MKSLNADAKPISMSIYEEMNENNCGIGGHPNFIFFRVLLFSIYVLGFNQISIVNRRYALKDFLQNIGLQIYKDCQGKSEIYRTG